MSEDVRDGGGARGGEGPAHPLRAGLPLGHPAGGHLSPPTAAGD